VYQSIVVGTDGTATAGRAVSHAIDICRRHRADLHLVSACRTVSPMLLMSPDTMAMAGVSAEAECAEHLRLGAALERAAGALRREGLAVTVHLGAGEPAELIVRVAQEVEADLIVVGNRGMSGVHRLLGSVPKRVSHRAPCSVLILRTA
jgi:nucleotide-binding universal stress UspA family protein